MYSYDIMKINNNFLKYSKINSLCMFGKKNESCLVSIIIPTYKRLNLLKEAIYSALNQTFDGDYEIIIVDNTDDSSYQSTYEWIRSLDSSRIIYYHNEDNIGMFGNWNRGLELASGEWVVILNDDDLLCEAYLDRMVYCAKKLPKETSIIGCHHYNMINSEINKSCMEIKRRIYNALERRAIPVVEKDMYFGAYLSLVGAFIKKETAIELGGFSEDFYPSSDFLFVITNVFHGCKLFYIPQKLAIYRIEDNESMKYHTFELFMRQQSIVKNAIHEKKHYLPQVISKKYRNDCLYLYEERMTKMWLDSDANIKSKIDELNKNLMIEKISWIERKAFLLIEKLRYYHFLVLRRYIKI